MKTADRFEFSLKSGNGKASGPAGPFALPYGQPESTRLALGPDGKPRSYSEIFVYL